MDRFAAQQAVSRFLDVPSGQIQPARLDPAAVPWADANQDGHVAADELVEALVADRVRIDAARQKVVPMVAALVDDAPPVAAPDSLPAAEGPPAALDAVPDAGEPA